MELHGQDVLGLILTATIPILSFFLRGIVKKMDENNKSLQELNTKIAVVLERSDNHKNDLMVHQKRIKKAEEKIFELEKRFASCQASHEKELI